MESHQARGRRGHARRISIYARGAARAGAERDFAIITQAWNLISRHYVDRAAIPPRRTTFAAVRGMVDSLGDTGHSVFLTPQMAQEDNERPQGRFPGVGAEVRMRDKQVVVAAPLDGSPAQKAGLRAGDIIFNVDGHEVAGETLLQVVRRIRGPAGAASCSRSWCIPRRTAPPCRSPCS